MKKFLYKIIIFVFVLFAVIRLQDPIVARAASGSGTTNQTITLTNCRNFKLSVTGGAFYGLPAENDSSKYADSGKSSYYSHPITMYVTYYYADGTNSKQSLSWSAPVYKGCWYTKSQAYGSSTQLGTWGYDPETPYNSRPHWSPTGNINDPYPSKTLTRVVTSCTPGGPFARLISGGVNYSYTYTTHTHDYTYT